MEGWDGRVMADFGRCRLGRRLTPDVTMLIHSFSSLSFMMEGLKESRLRLTESALEAVLSEGP